MEVYVTLVAVKLHKNTYTYVRATYSRNVRFFTKLDVLFIITVTDQALLNHYYLKCLGPL